MSGRTTKLTELSTYVESEIVTKVIKKKGKRGLISMSAYLRDLIMKDLETK